MTRLPHLAALAVVLILAATPRWAAAADALIHVPDSVDPGQAVAVTIVGGSGGGRIEIWGPDTGQGYATPAGGVAAGPTGANLAAPARPGSYELRLVDETGKLMARAELEVAAVPVVLRVPDPLGAGYDAEIEWRGPAAPGDMIQLFDPESGQVVSEAPALGAAGELNRTRIRAPETTGPFELRYRDGAGGTALRSLGIMVGAGRGFLRAPVEVTVRQSFTVEWVGLASPDQAYELVDPATGKVLDSQPALDSSGKAGPVAFTAPRKAGAYRMRYVNSGSGFVIADLPLDVDRN